MRRVLIALFLLCASALALAGEMPSAQWKASSLSLFELVEAGYSIVAVTKDASSGEMFFVQKGSSVFKCAEIHFSDPHSKNPTASLRCWALVKPYVVTLPQ